MDYLHRKICNYHGWWGLCHGDQAEHHGNIAIYHRADRYQSGNSRTNFRTNAAYYGSIYVHHGAEHIYQRDGHTYYRTSRMYCGAKRDQHRNKCSDHENTGAYSRNGTVQFFNK
jgi:hypothetical protein